MKKFSLNDRLLDLYERNLSEQEKERRQLEKEGLHFEQWHPTRDCIQRLSGILKGGVANHFPNATLILSQTEYYY